MLFRSYPIGMKKFINTFYTMKKTSSGAIKQGAKLFLNSSYGKLSQRLERQYCHYELDDQGIVHLVREDFKEDKKGMMSIIVGSRITSQARICLLQYIDEICHGNPKDNLIYCDTDSVHALTSFEDTDASELGKMKCEGIYQDGLYLAPKTYLMYDGQHYEVHCKGVNTEVVAQAISGMTFDDPSGSTSPSSEDKKVTERIKNAAALFDVHLTDSVILATDKYFSFVEEGII